MMDLNKFFPWKNKLILFSVLDWGLGHASRSIVIIKYLLSQNNILFIASSGNALILLRKELGSSVSYLDLNVNTIKYPSSNMIINILTQLPIIIKSHFKEKKLVDLFVKQNQIDLIISDHRYSSYSAHTKNYFIAHQLTILSSSSILSGIATRLNGFLINKFDLCFIPDEDNPYNLSGKLSRSKYINKKQYIGALSRLTQNGSSKKSIDILVLLSGPEPARTKFETELLKQLSRLEKLKIVLVRGKIGELNENFSSNLKVYPMLGTQDINMLMHAAKVVISRSGYTTLMDLHIMKKKALLIPTPGQTEQEYLANYHGNHKLWVFQKQKNLDLSIIPQLLN